MSRRMVAPGVWVNEEPAAPQMEAMRFFAGSLVLERTKSAAPVPYVRPLCDKWMPHAKDYCARRRDHRYDCASPAYIAKRNELRRAARAA